jgi:sigma-B regulation protein RsbU (phosphoserine phosphatase)
MGKRANSFSSRLTREIIIIVLVIMAGISLLAFYVTAKSLYSSFREHFADSIENISSSITANLEKVEISAVNMADELPWHLSSPEEVISTLQYEMNVNRNLEGCGMAFVPDYYPQTGRWFEPYAKVTESGISIKDIGSESHDYHNQEWYTSGLSSAKGVWSKPYLDTDGAGTLLCTYGVPIKTPDGKIAGVLGADMSLLWLVSQLKEIDDRENKLGSMPLTFCKKSEKIFSFILGPEGEYIAHPDNERFQNARNFFDYGGKDKSGSYRRLGENMCSGKTGEETTRIDGRRYNVFYAPVSSSGWSMGIAVPYSSLTGPGLALGSAILLLMLLGLAIVFRISRSTIRKFTKPLVQLAGSATEIAKGKFDAPLPDIDSEDEIGLLHDSFENMQNSLSKYIADLTETTAQKASMENELNVARSIQMAMLPMTWPAFPDRTDIDINGCLIPAKAVGGDLYDFCIRDNKLHFCIGDVSGKGVPASLVMAVISSMFRTLSASEESPASLISSINSSMASRNDNMMFVTLFAGELDLATGHLRYCNAGHNAPAVITDGKAKFLETDSNVAVGIVSDWDFSLQTAQLAIGSSLFLYTDGLTEATRSDGVLFGEDRTLSALATMKQDASADDICKNMQSAAKDFIGDAEQSDDLTILVISRL